MTLTKLQVTSPSTDDPFIMYYSIFISNGQVKVTSKMMNQVPSNADGGTQEEYTVQITLVSQLKVTSH